MTTNTKLSTQLDEGKHSARISIDGTLTAVEIETLIADLAVTRAHMLPTVPDSPPGLDDVIEEAHNLSVQENPRVVVARLSDGRMRFWVRNIGIGWLVFNLPVTGACAIRDYLLANTPAKGDPGLFKESGGDPNTSH